jgi:hypothetical protein
MGKKKRREHEHQPATPDGQAGGVPCYPLRADGGVQAASFMVPLDRLGLQLARPRFRWEQLWQNVSRQIGPKEQFAAIWFAATPAGSCCGFEHEPEAVIVGLPSEAVLATYRAQGAKESYNPIGITVYDGLITNSHLTALLDVEDAKQLVNRLSEAIAAAETRAALSSSARAKGGNDAR